MYLLEGKLMMDLKTGNIPKVILDNYDDNFNDGKWHLVVLSLSKDSLILNADNQPMKTVRKLDVTTGHTYYIGGKPGENRGFIGCMRMITIDENYKLPSDWKEDEYCCKSEVVFDSCQMVDRCNPNPCKHGALCTQKSDQFDCQCSGTGYGGAVCHTC